MGHCSDLPRLESDGLSRGTLGHLQSPIKKSDPPGCPGLERVVQSISSIVTWLFCLSFQYVTFELQHKQGSHPTWKTWIFVIYFSRPGKYLEFLKKWGKPGILIQNLEKKTWILEIWCFQNNFSRCFYQNSFTSLLYLNYQHQHCDSKPNIPWDFIAFIWK